MSTQRNLATALAALTACFAAGVQAGGALETVDITPMNVTVPGSVDGVVIPIKWDSRCLPLRYTLDSTPPNSFDPAPEIDIATTRRELQASMDQWNKIRTSFIEMNITAVADLRGGALTPPGVIGSFDFINELNFVTQGAFLAAAPSVSLIKDTTLSAGQDIDLDGDSDVFAPGGANGTTCRDVDHDGDFEFPAGDYKAGTILDNDVGFSATSGFPWNTTPDDQLTSDLQAVAVHELGHSHGLSHSLVNQQSSADATNATMFPFIDINDPASEAAQRTPATDDIAWSSFLYPEGTAKSGPAALRGKDQRFSSKFGLIKGEVTSGTLGGPVAGASIWVQDAHTGKIVTQGFSGTTQLLVVPGPTEITDVDAGLFFGPTAEFSILNGNYVIPVPQGAYKVGLESLDGEPAAPGNISITAIVGSVFTDLNFEEEFWNGRSERADETRPGDARPILVRNGRTTDGIDFVTNITNTLRNTDGDFDADDIVGFRDAPPGRLYAVRFSNEDVRNFIAEGSVLHTATFLTFVSDASAPVLFKSAKLVTGRLNADGTARIDLDRPLQRESPFLAQELDFSPLYFKLPNLLTLIVDAILELRPDKDLFLVLEVPNAPFPGPNGFAPQVGIDNDTSGSSFISDDGGATFAPQPDSNFFFELLAKP